MRNLKIQEALMHSKNFLWYIFTLFVFIGISTSQEVTISGTVTGIDSQVIENATVHLAVKNISTTTDASGKYNFADIGIKYNSFGKTVFTAPRFQRATISFSVVENNTPVRIDVFGVHGRHIHTIVDRHLPCGSYVFTLLKNPAPAQMYCVSLQVKGTVYTYKYLHVPAMHGNSRGYSAVKEMGDNTSVTPVSVTQTALPDTITVSKAGYISAQKVIDSYQGVHDFILDTICAHIRVTVLEDSTNIPISDADVVLFNSNTNQGITRSFTDSAGICLFTVQPNLPCYVKAAAQNYHSSPPPNGAAIPFNAGDSGTTIYREFKLRRNLQAVNCGIISGVAQSASGEPVAGCLVIAIRQGDSITVSGYSGPDGFYILYNVPEGVYDVQCFLVGWYQPTAVTSVTVTSGTITSGVNLEPVADTGAQLSGRITFLASQNSRVDVTLAHPVSYEAIPGLDTLMQETSTYVLNGIPPGTYIPWASYRNDGYVMDPDWIRKFGLPVLTFAPGDSAKELNFSITDAIPIISPTNHPDTLVPVAISTLTPTFVWESYPSTQEYIIAVYNNYGNLVWGGYDADNNVLHAKIDAHTTSVIFNFDSSAVEPIKWGYSYRWKVWADKDATDGVQQLISSSEDWLGLFYLVGE